MELSLGWRMSGSPSHRSIADDWGYPYCHWWTHPRFTDSAWQFQASCWKFCRNTSTSGYLVGKRSSKQRDGQVEKTMEKNHAKISMSFHPATLLEKPLEPHNDHAHFWAGKTHRNLGNHHFPFVSPVGWFNPWKMCVCIYIYIHMYIYIYIYIYICIYIYIQIFDDRIPYCTPNHVHTHQLACINHPSTIIFWKTSLWWMVFKDVASLQMVVKSREKHQSTILIYIWSFIN